VDPNTMIPNIWVIPIWACCWKGYHETVKVLLAGRADHSWTNTRGANSLCVASQENHLSVVKVLLDAAVDVTAEDDQGRCALWRACFRGNDEVVRTFIDSGMSVDKEKAEAQKALEELEEAEQAYFECTEARIPRLRKLRQADMILKELKSKVEFTRKGPQRQAALKAVKDAEIETEACGEELSAQDQRIKDAKAEVHWKETCAEKEVAESIEAARQINAPDMRGTTCLYAAAEQGHSTIVAQLLQARADVDVRTNKIHGGSTPLLVACRNGHDEVAMQLTAANGDSNMKSDDGVTPLMMAVKYDHASTVMVLLDAQANVNIKSKKGLAAIQIASQMGHAAVVDLLLDGRKCQMNLVEWKQLAEEAKQSGHTVIHRMILASTESSRGPGSFLAPTGENTVPGSSPKPFLPWPSPFGSPGRIQPFGDVLEQNSRRTSRPAADNSSTYPSANRDLFGIPKGSK